jgi:hypothetical protein
MDASWVKAYKSVAELRKDSTVAVTGTFGLVQRQEGDPKSLLSRDYAFTVDKVADAKPGINVTVGQVISIHQTGGIADGVAQQVADDPLFQTGEKPPCSWSRTRPAPSTSSAAQGADSRSTTRTRSRPSIPRPPHSPERLPT